MKNKKFEALYIKAEMAGIEAVSNIHYIRPMVVVQHANPMDDRSPVNQKWVVPDGPCGFAWVVIKPGTSSFARWLKKNGYADNHYYGGVSIWISRYNQSITKKEVHAHAMVKVFADAGIRAYSNSRMD